MAKFKVVLSASYTIDADNEDDAINEAVNELADELYKIVPYECDLSVSTLAGLFGANAEEIGKGGEE